MEDTKSKRPDQQFITMRDLENKVQSSSPILKYPEAAEYLRMSEVHLRRLKRRGEIPFVPIGDRGIRFRRESLDAWICQREISS
jgi:excisionase family DNA binding protein